MLKKFFALPVIFALINVTFAGLSGSTSVTPEDYYGLGPQALETSYPACGMPYNELNLARITAVEDIDISSECGQCLEVTNSNNGESIFVLAVDKGGQGLDISIPSFESLFGQSTDPAPASWAAVDISNCEGIHTPGRENPSQEVFSKRDSGVNSIIDTFDPSKLRKGNNIASSTASVLHVNKRSTVSSEHKGDSIYIDRKRRAHGTFKNRQIHH
ncbi:hypothetical protein CU098_005305 [Rhizopus stolonifer]|uniref:Barwin domain-containing protein n=1 Tax=Rhizopus stolonifer TaxID=4846 RepID=A0A367J3R9_RHIST|nr:hypothetical protein CU098_005305 [Rhizopus stolonifer]